MACKYGVQDIFLGSAFAWIQGNKGHWIVSVFERDLRRSATFMCRTYLVAYKFRFDFIRWREPSTSCASSWLQCPILRYTPNVDNCGASTTTSFIFRSHVHGDFRS